jgi:hypothetical protein
MHMAGIKAQAIFDFLRVNLATDGGGTNLVEIMPRLTLAGDSQATYKWMNFIRTRVFEGNITVGGEKFKAHLGDDFVIHGGLDSPYTALVLSPRGILGGPAFDWWGGDRLMSIHKVRGRFFTFSASAAGDQLSVHPYTGDLGTVAVEPGGRKLTELSISGSFEAQDRAVPVGGDIDHGRPEPARSCQLPVGDYLPSFIDVQFGNLQLQISQNYHSEGKRMDRAGRAPVYGIAVRKDQPFVLNFTNPPDVMFTSPTNGQRIKLGDTVQVSALLVDPKLDIMIRRLGLTHKQGDPPEPKLDPQVVITRANGEKVAAGVMPFG